MSAPISKYPALIDVLKREAFACFYQTAFIGIILTYIFLPWYQFFLPLLQALVVKCAPMGFDKDAIVFSLMFNLVHSISYISWNIFFSFCDHFKLLLDYKLDRKTYMEPKWELITKALVSAAFGQLFAGFTVIYLSYPYFKYFGMFELNAELPPVSHMFMCYVCSHEVNYFLFYAVHRLFHLKYFYSLFHKQHHEFSGPISISAEYANPVEMLFANVAPTLFGAVLFGTHPLCIIVILVIRLQVSYESHSGYSFEGTFLDTIGLCHGNQTVHHDYHHTVNTGNFGTEFYDYIFGTMGESYLNEGCKDGYTLNHRGVTHSSFPRSLSQSKLIIENVILD